MHRAYFRPSAWGDVDGRADVVVPVTEATLSLPAGPHAVSAAREAIAAAAITVLIVISLLSPQV